MLTPANAKSLNISISEDSSKSKDKGVKSKLKFFHGRDPENFPRVKFDINDHEFVELLRDMDHIYEAVHNLNQVFVKYSAASTSIQIILANII